MMAKSPRSRGIEPRYQHPSNGRGGEGISLLRWRPAGRGDELPPRCTTDLPKPPSSSEGAKCTGGRKTQAKATATASRRHPQPDAALALAPRPSPPRVPIAQARRGRPGHGTRPAEEDRVWGGRGRSKNPRVPIAQARRGRRERLARARGARPAKSGRGIGHKTSRRAAAVRGCVMHRRPRVPEELRGAKEWQAAQNPRIPTA